MNIFHGFTIILSNFYYFESHNLKITQSKIY